MRLSQSAVANPLLGSAAEVLVQELGRHGANAISRADGRLAGFTNKQVQRVGGRNPFVLVTECKGKVAPAAPAYLARLEQELEKAREKRQNKECNPSFGHKR